mgnify:CR=1 FL=1
MGVSIKGVIAGRNKKYKDVAAAVKIRPNTFYKKLDKNSFTLAEAEKILEVLGMKLVLADK